MKKVLYISYDGLTDPLGQSQILPYLVGLSEFGYAFTILSFEKKDRFAKEGQIVREICAEAGIEWRPLFFTKRPPILSKIYDRWRMSLAIKKLHQEKNFDMVHCRSYISSEFGLRLKRKYGVPFLFDMRGFWADEKVDGGQWNLSNPLFRRIYRHYKQMEKEFLLNADAIISLTAAARDEIHRQTIYSKISIDVVPCCADLAHFDFHKNNPEVIEQLRRELNIPNGKKLLTYLGSVGGWYMTKEMFSFFSQAIKTHNDYLLLILTKDEPSHILTEAATMGISPEMIRVTYAPRHKLPDYMSLSTCSIFFIRPTYSKMASSPTKHAELMGMGIPVICNELGDTGRIINETNTGLIVERFDAEAYQQVIDQMPQLESINPETIRNAAFRYFDLMSGIAQYRDVYERIFMKEVN